MKEAVHVHNKMLKKEVGMKRHFLTALLIMTPFTSTGVHSQTMPAGPSTRTSASRPAHVIYETPMAACVAYCQLTLDASPNATADVCIVTLEELRPAWEAMEGESLARRRLERAVANRFLQGGFAVIEGWSMETAMNSILKRLPDARIDISSDGLLATVTYPDEKDPNYPKAEPFYCQRDDKGWRVDVVRTEPVTSDEVKMISTNNQEAQTYDKLTADVVSGKFASVAEIRKLLDAMPPPVFPAP